jgi:type II secretory pathway component PulF
MPTYSYKAVETGGAQVAGVLTAENQQVVLRILQEKSLFPLLVEESQGSTTLTGQRKGIKLKHLTTYYQQFSDLLRAGVPMMRSLDVLANQQGSPPSLRQALKEGREDVVGGATLADALAKNPQIFSELHCSMIRAGERGGFLEDVLARLSIFAEKQDALQSKLVGAMIYPAILLVMGGAVITLIMTVVVPKLRPFMKPETMNVATEVLFASCDVLVNHYVLLIGIVLALIIGVQWFRSTAIGKRAMAIAALKAPLIGPVYTSVSVSRFCRILGTLLQNGVPVLQSLKIAKDSAGNEVLAEHIEAATESVRQGETLSVPLGKSGLFPGDILSMIAVAEESNNLENVLVQIAETNEVRTERTIETTVRLVEPLLLVGMAGMVGGIAFALLLPILKMGAGGAGF